MLLCPSFLAFSFTNHHCQLLPPGRPQPPAPPSVRPSELTIPNSAPCHLVPTAPITHTASESTADCELRAGTACCEPLKPSRFTSWVASGTPHLEDPGYSAGEQRRSWSRGLQPISAGGAPRLRPGRASERTAKAWAQCGQAGEGPEGQFRAWT